jgi:hypothetical protein
MLAACSYDAITAIATCVAAVIALVAALIAIWQARYTTRVQVLLQLDSYWASDAMRATRRKAATALLKGKPTADVDRVLDYFETIAGIFVKRHGLFGVLPGILPDKWAQHTFYWYAVCYWSKSRDYIEDVRQRSTEKAAWEDFCEIMPRWINADGVSPTQKDIDDFLADEQSA